MKSSWLAMLLVSGAAVLPAQDDVPVFRSDVTLVRVDVQVVGRDNRAISGLTKADFVLRDSGRTQPIRNFSTEQMPIDILLLLDVSGSMRPHVERIAMAADEALSVLGPDDRVAIMVFDRRTRLSMPLRGGARQIQAGLDAVLERERFNGGTDISRGLLDAAEYLRKSARRDARRAIVILTDDQSEFPCDQNRILHALAEADAVLSAILAPDALRGRYPGTTYPPGRFPGGGWPGRFPGGGWPGGGGSWPGGRGPVIIATGTRAAGSGVMARESGGDSLSIDDAGAFEDTLSRLRERYALHFLVPEGARAGEERTLDVNLSAAARRRYPDAEVRFRRTYIAPGAGLASTPVETSDAGAAPEELDDPDADPDRPQLKRRQPVGISRGDGRERASARRDVPAVDPDSDPDEQSVPTVRRTRRAPVNEPGGPRPAVIGGNSNGGWRRAEDADGTGPGSPAASRPAPAETRTVPASKPVPAENPSSEPVSTGGWRKATEADLAPPPEPEPAKKPKKKG